MKKLSIEKKNEELKDKLINIFKIYAFDTNFEDWSEKDFSECDDNFCFYVPFLGNSLFKKLASLDVDVHVTSDSFEDCIVILIFKYM